MPDQIEDNTAARAFDFAEKLLGRVADTQTKHDERISKLEGKMLVVWIIGGAIGSAVVLLAIEIIKRGLSAQ